jgi:hypothetical protein
VKLVVDVPLPQLLAEVPGRADLFLGAMRRTLNERIEEADRRLQRPGAPRELRRARDRAARSVMTADRAVLTFTIRGVRIIEPTVELAGLAELEGELGRDALRTFARPATPALLPAAIYDDNAAAQEAAEGKTT